MHPTGYDPPSRLELDGMIIGADGTHILSTARYRQSLSHAKVHTSGCLCHITGLCQNVLFLPTQQTADGHYHHTEARTKSMSKNGGTKYPWMGR